MSSSTNPNLISVPLNGALHLPSPQEVSLRTGVGTINYYLTRCFRDVLSVQGQGVTANNSNINSGLSQQDSSLTSSVAASKGQQLYHPESSSSEIVSDLLSPAENAEAAKCLREVLLEIDLTEDKPWRKERGMQDFFNYDLNEKQFREFIRNQIRLRFERRSRNTLGQGPSVTSGYLGQSSGRYGHGYGKSDGYGSKGNKDRGGPYNNNNYNNKNNSSNYNNNMNSNYNSNYNNGLNSVPQTPGGQGLSGLNTPHNNSNILDMPSGAMTPGALLGSMTPMSGGLMTPNNLNTNNMQLALVGGPEGSSPGYDNEGGGQNKGGGKGSKPECESLYVVGFPREWDKTALHKFFSDYGIVQTTHVIPPQNEQQSNRSAGIVSFLTTRMARETLNNTNGMSIDNDHTLEVKFKLPGRFARQKGEKY